LNSSIQLAGPGFACPDRRVPDPFRGVTLGLPLQVLFAWRYQQSGSLFTSSLEHALYGCLMFTIGLGEYFYKGAR